MSTTSTTLAKSIEDVIEGFSPYEALYQLLLGSLSSSQHYIFNYVDNHESATFEELYKYYKKSMTVSSDIEALVKLGLLTADKDGWHKRYAVRDLLSEMMAAEQDTPANGEEG